MWEGLNNSWNIGRKAALDFAQDNCFRSSAALSYYTLFSVAPVVIITVSTIGLFVDEAIIREEVTDSFRTLIGNEGAQGVLALMETVSTGDSGIVSLAMGIALLIFAATTIFVQIQKGLNEIYRVRPVEGRQGWIKKAMDRLVSIGIILSLGFAMFISLALDTLISAFIKALDDRFQALSALLLQLSQNLLLLGLVLLVIYALFRWLPDVELPRKYIMRGAVMTTVLLLAGKFVIGWYIGRSNLTQLGGAASSIVILMLWVYFSSMILFFGAELIKAQTHFGHQGYRAGRYAKRVKVVEIDQEEATGKYE